MKVAVNFENFDKTVQVRKSRPGLYSNGVRVVIPDFAGGNRTIAAGEALDLICGALVSLGIELSYELDQQGRLVTVTFDQRVGRKKRHSETGGFEQDKPQWTLSIESKVTKTQGTEFKGSDFKAFQEFLLHNNDTVVFKCLKKT